MHPLANTFVTLYESPDEKDCIELHIEDGAELRFSQTPEDYLPSTPKRRGSKNAGAWISIGEA